MDLIKLFKSQDIEDVALGWELLKSKNEKFISEFFSLYKNPEYSTMCVITFGRIVDRDLFSEKIDKYNLTPRHIVGDCVIILYRDAILLKSLDDERSYKII